MASTYSTNLKIELIGTGDQSGTWGTTTNNNFEFAVEEAVTGIGTANFPADADLTLTLSNTNTTQVPRNLVLNVTSGVSLSTTRSLIVPTIEKQYLVWNNTTGGQAITVKTSTGSGVTVPNGAKAHLMVDATDVVRAFDNVDINSGTIDGVVIGGSTPAAGSFTTLSATGNITVGGTVDGRDVAADGTKLDTVETNADVTDTANVTAAGALMDSELTDIAAVKALDQGVATTDSPSFAGLTATTADINGGTIDGATIGGSSAAPGTFTNLEASGTVKLNGNFPTGTNNVALGENALGDASLSGGTNTAIGDNALFSNTTGTANSALGGNAMYSNLSGQSNAAVGNAALFTNDTGSYNAAFGAGALYSNTASYNVAAGYRALYTNSTGADNVAVGYYALYTNSTGGSNVAVGESALTVATGSSNTAIGKGAGSLITTGAKNTIIGAYDGNQGGLDIRTASNYIVLSDGDGNPRAYHNGTLWTFDSLSSTTVDTTSLEVTNLKAKDGTVAGSIADSTGVVTLSSSVLTTTDINGGSVDGVTLGTNSAVTEAQIDNIKIDGNTISSTNTNGNVTITPDGTGSVAISKIDVAGGEIDGTAIGATSASTGNFSTLSISDTAITATATELNILDGVTATSSELNVLDGITATTTELNYTDGVTSNIQTQLDAKAPLASPSFTGTVSATTIDVGFLEVANLRARDGTTAGSIANSTGVVTLASSVLTTTDINGGSVDGVTLGTNSAITALTVSGTIKLGGNFDANNNVALGSEALDGSALVLSGTDNTAVGHQALSDTSSGGNNVAVGSEALRDNATGGQNIAVGRSALAVNIAGSDNTAVGFQALLLSTASDNTAVGYRAMRQNTLGNNNTAVGHEALEDNTIGVRNVALGNQSLTRNTEGNDNVAVGRTALTFNTTGDNNVAVGRDALIGNTTGFNNVAMGFDAGESVTTGSNNVAIGYGADVSGSSASGQIVIGASVTGTADTRITVGFSTNIAELDLDGSDTSWAASSDERLKTGVADYSAGLGFITALRPVTYQWRAKRDVPEELTAHHADSDEPVHGDPGKTYHGFIAQEVRNALDAHPEVADGQHFWKQRNDGVQTLAPADLIPILVNAVKEQQEQINALKTEIELLKGA